MQRLIGERADQRFVIALDDHHAVVGHRVPAPILFEIVADERAARNQDVAVDDGPLDARVASDPDARHQDASIDMAETVDADVGAEDAARNRAARYDATGRDDRIKGLAASASGLREDELRGR